MDELLDLLRSFDGGEVVFKFDKSINGFKIIASRGKFWQTVGLADVSTINRADNATLLVIKAVRQVREREAHAERTRGEKHPGSSSLEDRV
jgi:hypothetical protein